MIVNIISMLVSAIAAVATVAAAWVAVQTLKTQTTPDVIAYIAPHRQSEKDFCILIKNIGHAPAYGVKLSFPEGLPPLSEGFVQNNMVSLSKVPIAILAPGQSREVYLGTYRDLDPLWATNTYMVEVDYGTKLKGKGRRVAHFPLELHSFSTRVDITTTTQEDRDRRSALKQAPAAAKSLARIASAMDRAFPDAE